MSSPQRPVAELPAEGHRGESSTSAPCTSAWRTFAVAAIVLTCFSFGFGLANGIGDGRLQDTDAYTWAYRAADLRSDMEWFNDTLERVNPPAGHVQHWTRPFDALLVAGGLLGEPFIGFRSSLIAWAVMLPWLLGVATLATLWWAFADVLDDAGRDGMGLVAGAQPAVITGFLAGRADHQALMGLLLVLLVGLCRRGFGRAGSDVAVRWAGIVSGLALWVGMEAIAMIVGLLAALSVQWIMRGDATMRRLREYAITLAATSLLALGAEHGMHGLWTAQFDELSPMLVAAASLLAVACHAVTEARPYLTTLGRRATALTVSAVVVLGLLLAVWPGIVNGPLGNVDPLYARTRLRQIGELQPSVTSSPIVTIGRLATGLSLVPFVLLFVIRRIRVRASLFTDGEHLLLIPGVLYFVLGLMQQRWLFALNLLLVVPAALGIQRMMHTAAPRAQRVHLGMATVALSAALWWLPVQIVVADNQPDIARCDTDDAVAALEGTGDATVMAFVDIGPELLFRTTNSVMSIPNHRPQPGYAATYEAMSTSGPEVARGIMREHGVDLVLVCTDAVEVSFYGASEQSLHHRLVAGDPPTWLTALPTPEAQPNFRLYRVTD